MPAELPARSNERSPLNVLATILNLLRGALIGAVEIIPGVSGGTIALIVGVYEDLIRGASHILKGAVALLLAPFRSGGETGRASGRERVEQGEGAGQGQHTGGKGVQRQH